MNKLHKRHALVVPAARKAFCRGVAVFALCAVAAFLPTSARAWSWEAVAKADLEAKDSTHFPGADAEILLSTHEIREKGDQQVAYTTLEGYLKVTHFVRAKIYTVKGVQEQGKVFIRNNAGYRIDEARARVVKPDGQSIELKKDDIITSLEQKDKDGSTWKKMAFVFPGLEPGDVVELMCSEVSVAELWSTVYFVQQPVAVREFRFTVASMKRRGSINWLNCPNVTTSDKGDYTVIVRDVPVFDEEEYMPPEKEHRALVYMVKYFREYPTDKDVWKFLSQEYAAEFGDLSRPASAVKAKAQALVEGATTDDEKLKRLYEFCQKEIYNTTYWKNAELQTEIERHRDEEASSPAKVLSKGHGRKDEIDNLFAAFARALGYEVKLAQNPNRASVINIKIPAGWAFLTRRNIAVKVAGEWRYFAPGSYYVPYGFVSSRDERAPTLLCDDKMDFGTIGFASADKSQAQRKARLALDAEGTLEGDVEETYTGQQAITRKEDNHGDETEKVNEAFRKEINKRIPSAEVTDIVWTNLSTNVMPLSVKYHVRIPSYAQQAGKRLIFSPCYFEFGKSPVLAPEKRKYPIFFPFPTSDHDDIEIKLPEGYVLDKPSAPSPVGAIASAFGAEYQLNYKPKVRTFFYRRDFVLGGDGACAFHQDSYPELRSLFAMLQKSDAHSIVLKPKAPVQPAAEPAAAAPAGSSAQPEPATQKRD
jgi:Skp family chaperone for outer membrane proteins